MLLSVANHLADVIEEILQETSHLMPVDGVYIEMLREDIDDDYLDVFFGHWDDKSQFINTVGPEKEKITLTWYEYGDRGGETFRVKLFDDTLLRMELYSSLEDFNHFVVLAPEEFTNASKHISIGGFKRGIILWELESVDDKRTSPIKALDLDWRDRNSLIRECEAWAYENIPKIYLPVDKWSEEQRKGEYHPDK